jgi:hypothetical protein
MTKKTYRRLVVGYLQWSIIGLIIALFVAFISSDPRSVVYGVPAAGSAASGDLALPTSTAPASAPIKPPEAVAPDTINGELVWPDPWDRITNSDRPFY